MNTKRVDVLSNHNYNIMIYTSSFSLSSDSAFSVDAIKYASHFLTKTYQ